MKKTSEQLEALQDIRQMMKQSSRFLSLSGFSGIMAGIYALGGVYWAGIVIERDLPYADLAAYDPGTYWPVMKQFVWISLTVLSLSLVTAYFFSRQKAKKRGHKLFDHTAWRLMINMMIPLATGGIFCLALLLKGFHLIGLISPAMLIFYGLALVNGSKYTLHEIRYLGCMEIVLGLIASFYMSAGLLMWAIGFGVLHIIYGAWMWFKYDRN